MNGERTAADMSRKVAFYRLSVRDPVDDKEILLKEAFQYIRDVKLKTVPQGDKAIDLQYDGNIYVAQVMREDGDMVFIRIGRQHPSNTVALRDRDTLESDEVKMTGSQMLEVYTICLLDLSTGIVCYIGMSGAPRVRVIREMFLLYDRYEKETAVELDAILTKDVLKRIAGKRIINSIECTVAVPSDDLLEKTLGLTESAFDELRNIKDAKMTFQIKADRNRTLFTDAGKFEKFMNLIGGRWKDKINRMTVKAKNTDEILQTFNIMEDAFTVMVNLDQADIDTVTDERLADLLLDTYNRTKSDILSYITI